MNSLRSFPVFTLTLTLVTSAIGVAATAIAPAVAEASRSFRAGADRTDVTPDLGVMVIGSPAGAPARVVHDPLSVRTLVLDDGAIRLGFAVVDHVGLSQAICEDAKKQIAERTGIPKTHMLISSTHTHSGGAGNPVFLARRISDSVRNAIARLEPAKVGWGVGHEPGQVFNRRWHMKSEEHRRNPFGVSTRCE